MIIHLPTCKIIIHTTYNIALLNVLPKRLHYVHSLKSVFGARRRCALCGAVEQTLGYDWDEWVNVWLWNSRWTYFSFAAILRLHTRRIFVKKKYFFYLKKKETIKQEKITDNFSAVQLSWIELLQLHLHYLVVALGWLQQTEDMLITK